MIKEKLQNIKSSHRTNLENQGSDNLQHGWEIKKLGEVCEIVNGSTPLRSNKDFWENGNFPWFTIDDIREQGRIISKTKQKVTEAALSKLRVLPKDTVLLCCTASVGEYAITKIELTTNQQFNGLIVKDRNILSPEFLMHYCSTLKDKLLNLSGKTTIDFIAIGKLKSLEIPLPPLHEQQRIVSILDEAFAAIEKAKANAEQNLKNAKELFESYLQGVFEKKGDGWEKKKLGEVIEYDKNQNIHKGLPYVGLEHIESNSGRFVGSLEPQVVKSSTFYFNEQHVLYGRLRPYLNKVLLPDFEGHCSTEIFPIKVGKQIAREFLFYWLIAGSTVKKIDATWTGARMPRANMNQVLEFDFAFPPLEEQQTIIRQLDALRAETQKLEELYQKKIDNLEELKKSILQKAFNGELSSSVSASASVGKVIPLRKVNGISATDLQAGITAFALKKHIDKNQQHSFHHVKAEKIVHLSEYILNIDLERNPVKDAAGPNDFPRAKKVESRARKAGFYYVFKNGESYDYQIGRNINSVIQNTLNSLGEKADTLSQIIDLLIPINTQQAEIVATVYAAWNNLLLRGVPFSDEDIVTEARENWHPAKKNFSKDRFFNAIEWIRKNELLIPKGNGKLISKK
jgi:Restriction endonuclease S subunits